MLLSRTFVSIWQVTVLLMLLTAPPVFGQDEAAAKAKLVSLARASRSSDIESVDVFRLPKGYESVSQVGPEDIEKRWHIKMTIRELRPPREELIAAALGVAQVRRSDRTWDLRWGIVFYSRSGRGRIGALYFDESGRYGSVDRTSVSFGSDFFGKLKNALHLSVD